MTTRKEVQKLAKELEDYFNEHYALKGIKYLPFWKRDEWIVSQAIRFGVIIKW